MTSPLVTPAGEPALYDEITRVNNELVNLQRELSRKNVELARLNELKNELLGMAAHDLRNPLGVILAYAEMLETEAALTPEHATFVTAIRSTTEQMVRLINDLLDVSQIEAGSLTLDFRAVNLTELVRRNAALNAILAAKKRIQIVCDAAPLPLMPLDAPKIEQVLHNLLSNAVKFSYPATRVTVRLERDADGAVLVVTDQGQGIPATDLPGLFKPFSRTHVRATAGESSTGLGLSIVRRIVEGHRGRIAVESKVGEGSTFRVWLPIEREAAPRAT